MMAKGLRKHDVERMLHEKIDSDPDLKYYVDNEYVTRLVDLLIEGIGEIIENNNEKLVDNLFRRR